VIVSATNLLSGLGLGLSVRTGRDGAWTRAGAPFADGVGKPIERRPQAVVVTVNARIATALPAAAADGGLTSKISCVIWAIRHDAAVQMIDTSIVRVHQHAACIATPALRHRTKRL
jgi:hypothetical protein